MFQRAGPGGVRVASIVGALACASTAHATFFSFASDVNSGAFTFRGNPINASTFQITDFSRPNTFNLVIDDNNGPLGSITIPVEFRANLTASNGQSTALTGPAFQHTYRVGGTFSFHNAAGQVLLTGTLGNQAGILTVPGTQNAWATSGAILGSDSFGAISYTATAALVAAMGGEANAAAYGIVPGTSIGPDDFGFTLTNLNLTSGSAVTLQGSGRVPTAEWRAESSFSGSTLIPAPGTGALALAGMTALGRRRRVA